MIGLPSTYRAGQQRPQPPEDEYSAYLAQMRASGLPSSTMPSAAHSGTGGRSLDQHPNASTLDNGNAHFGVFEPQAPARSYSSFAPLLSGDAARQQVPGEFVPGGGGGVYRPRPHPQVQTQSIGDVSRSSTVYSDPSSSANLSPVRQGAPNSAYAQSFASPPDYSNPSAFTFPGPTNHPLEYPSSGSDPFPPSDQYTSPSPGKYMSSPEQLQIGHIPPHQPRSMGSMFATTSPPFTSPPRPGPAPYGGSTGEAWLPATGLAPSSIVPISGNASSGGSSGGGARGGGAYSGSSGGYSAGSNPNVPRPGVDVSRSRSTGGGSGGNATRYQHTHTQSAGLLAPPTTHKRQRRMPDEDDDSDSDEEGTGHGPGGGQVQAIKRL
ncbi:hypothetical protein FRC08_008575 [Ceratobasidium sp. 394]|nr:hypothetical protein FRC08_008575 [Ceratobasidium sp. 394]